MVKKDFVCTSCKSKLIGTQGSVTFKCPHCGKKDITRCQDCRKNSIKYNCVGCSFEGPN